MPSYTSPTASLFKLQEIVLDVRWKRQRGRGIIRRWVKLDLILLLHHLHLVIYLQTVENYMAKAVITALNNVFGVRNLPHTIVTNAGKNITNSRKLILESLQTGFTKKDLEDIKSTWSQINWTVVPPAAPHRIGAAESMVKATKRSLRYLPTSLLSILEFDAVLKNIASTINNHPLGFNIIEDQVLTPNQILLGCN